MIPNRYGTVRGRRHTYKQARRRLVWKRYRMCHGKYVWTSWSPLTGKLWTCTDSLALPPLPGQGVLPTMAMLREHILFPERRPLLPLPTTAFDDPNAHLDSGAVSVSTPLLPKNYLADPTVPDASSGLSYNGIARDYVSTKIVKRVPKRIYEYVHVIQTLPSELILHDPEQIRQQGLATSRRHAEKRARHQAAQEAREREKTSIQDPPPVPLVDFDRLDLRIEEGKVVRDRRRTPAIQKPKPRRRKSQARPA